MEVVRKSMQRSSIPCVRRCSPSSSALPSPAMEPPPHRLFLLRQGSCQEGSLCPAASHLFFVRPVSAPSASPFSSPSPSAQERGAAVGAPVRSGARLARRRTMASSSATSQVTPPWSRRTRVSQQHLGADFFVVVAPSPDVERRAASDSSAGRHSSHLITWLSSFKLHARATTTFSSGHRHVHAEKMKIDQPHVESAIQRGRHLSDLTFLLRLGYFLDLSRFTSQAEILIRTDKNKSEEAYVKKVLDRKRKCPFAAGSWKHLMKLLAAL